ncbi:MAG: Enterochelin esterase [Myxococcota bacterium]|nr:Enterochelin esterase [Myxococcota bacterium]
MSLAIRQFLASPKVDEPAVDRFLASHRFPVCEGTTTTFVWRGEAEDVQLQHWVYGLPSSQKFERIAGTTLWYLIIELPPGSRIEYKLNVVRDGKTQWMQDPLNPLLAHDPFGANSVVQCPGYEVPDWIHHDPQAMSGELLDFHLHSKCLADRRRLTVYLPPRFRKTRRYPLLVVHDGGDYLNFARMKVVMDNLIHRLEVSSMIVAFTYPEHRLVEYPDNPFHAKFIAEEVCPFIEGRFPINDSPAARGLMGASFGAVASLACAWRYPGKFGRLLLQSGSFAFTDIGTHWRGPTFEPVVRFVNAFRDNPGRPSDRIYLSCGMYESLIYENRSILPLLQATGMEVKYTEVRDGHNWENWRDRLREGLSWLFPGPLWMVYE